MRNERLESVDEWFLRIAEVVALRSTCARRAVGCVLVDRRGRVLSVGYNGPPRDAVHCIDVPCEGVEFVSGQGLDFCQAVHAEQNAIVQLRGDSDDVRTAYCTVSPCMACAKLLANTGCLDIVSRELYAEHQLVARFWRDVRDGGWVHRGSA